MDDASRHLSRKQLYDLVWSKPMSAIAKEFDISDVGLGEVLQTRRSNKTVAVVVREQGKPRHPVVRALEELVTPGIGRDQMLCLRGTGHSILRCGKETMPRALSILDTLFRTVEALGHVVRLRRTELHGGRRQAIEIVVGNSPVVRLTERAA